MDKADLSKILRDLDWSQADLSRKLGVHQNTVSAWATGRDPVPGYAAEYLRVARLAKEALS